MTKISWEKVFYLPLVGTLQTILAYGIFIVTLFLFSHSLNFFKSSTSLYTVVLIIIPFALFVPSLCAIWTFNSANHLQKMNIDTLVPPITWAVIILFFWLPGFTIFLFLKQYYFIKSKPEVAT